MLWMSSSVRAEEKLSAHCSKCDLKGLIPFLGGLLAGAAGGCLRGTAVRSAKHSKELPTCKCQVRRLFRLSPTSAQ